MAAGIRSCSWARPLHVLPPIKRVDGFCCCSTSSNGKSKETQTPQLLKIAVGGVTELLRLFVPSGSTRTALADNELDNEISVSSANDVLLIIRSDYEKAYFVTGFFTSAIYAEDCIFEDPTIKFQGKELYARNLSLLLPFFENPSIQLKGLDKVLSEIIILQLPISLMRYALPVQGLDSETEFIIASWKLRTNLKLPWTPLILINGTTRYDLDEEFRIVRHVERWNVSALEAILQIFTPSSVSSDR